MVQSYKKIKGDQEDLEAEQSPKVYLTIKVMEISNAQPILCPNTVNNQNKKETPQKAPTEGKKSNNKGKRKRKGEEMIEDGLLWQRRKGGQDVSRSERQRPLDLKCKYRNTHC